MFKSLLAFFKNLLRIKDSLVVMENQSTLVREMSSVIPLNISTNELVIQSYIFNIKTQQLCKSNIVLNYTLVDIFELTPWGLIGINQDYQLVNLNFLSNDLYLMNTNDFPCIITQNSIILELSPLAQVYDLNSATKLSINGSIELLNEKQISYPVFNQNFMDKNAKFLSEDQLFLLFNQIDFKPICDLNDSLDIFDKHLSSNTRVFGHRWSLGSHYYYSESKLSELDRSCLKTFNEWQNMPVIWEAGQVAIININETNLLIEVISVSEDSVWFVDRQLACKKLQENSSKESALLTSQSNFLIKNINKFLIIKN